MHALIVTIVGMMCPGGMMGCSLTASGSGPPPTDTFYILTENSDRIVTEASDPLVTEDAP